MQTFESEITQIIKSIWSAILELEVERVNEPFTINEKENTLIGCVHITGGWSGTVALQCPVPLARKAAAIMFSEKESEADMSDIKDALGELANMAGGNIKSLYTGQCYLSLPTVAVTDFDLHVLGSELVTSIPFQCEGHRFMVTLLKKAENKK